MKRYIVVSLAVYQNRLFFTAIVDKPYRKETAGAGMLLYLEKGKAVKFTSPASDEILVEAKDPYLFSSLVALAFMFTTGSGREFWTAELHGCMWMKTTTSTWERLKITTT